MRWVREAMIGWHQGRAERHEEVARHERQAERRWRDSIQPDPYRCRGGQTFESPVSAMEWAYNYAEWSAARKGARLLEAPSVYHCTRGHLHAEVRLEVPPTIRA